MIKQKSASRVRTLLRRGALWVVGAHLLVIGVAVALGGLLVIGWA